MLNESRGLYHFLSHSTTKDVDIDTMSVSSFLPEKSLFIGIFRLFLFWMRFKVQADLVHFRFKMGIFACTLK